MLTKLRYLIGGFLVAVFFSLAYYAFAAVLLPPSVQTGDLLKATSNSQLSRLATGSEGTVLKIVSGIPAWSTDLTGGSGSVANGLPGFVTRYTSTSTITTGILLDNATVAGANATSSTVSFTVQGTGALNPFNVSSSSGTSYLTVVSNGLVGVNSSSPIGTLAVRGQSGSTAPLVIASSTGTILLQVNANGSTTISSLGAGLVRSTSGGSLYTDSTTYLSSLNGQTGATQTFSTSTTATGLVLNITSATNAHNWALALSSGYNIPLTASTTNWNGVYDNVLSRLVVSTGTAGSNFHISTTTNSITINCPTASASVRGCLSTTDFLTFSNKQDALGGGVPGFVSTWSSTNNLTVGKLMDNGTVVGVNATSSTVNLTVRGSGTLNPFNVSSSSGTSILSVTSGGNVGIGTSTPATPLVVVGSTTLSSLTAANCDVKSTTGGSLYCGVDATGSSTGNAAWTIGNALIYNATSTDSVLVGTTTPTTAKLFVQGNGTKDPLVISSSTGTTLFQVTASAQILTCTTCRLTIPQGTAPTLSAAGDIAVDTSDNQLIFYGSSERVLPSIQEKCFSLENASSTADTNIPIWSPRTAITITNQYCRTEGGTSATLQISDGTNNMETIVCDSDGQADDGSLTNNTFTANERVEVDVIAVSGSVTWVNFCNSYTTNRQ